MWRKKAMKVVIVYMDVDVHEDADEDMLVDLDVLV